MKRFCLLMVLLGCVIPVVLAAKDDKEPPLNFMEVEGVLMVETTAVGLAGPRYLKTSYWQESGTNIIHLEFFQIQNNDICKRTKTFFPVKWSLNDYGVNMANRDKYEFKVKRQHLYVTTKETEQMMEMLYPKKLTSK